MKLADVMSKPLLEVIKDMELVSFRPVTNDGVVESIELEYVPKENLEEEPVAGDNRSDLFKSNSSKRRHY